VTPTPRLRPESTALLAKVDPANVDGWIGVARSASTSKRKRVVFGLEADLAMEW